MKNSSTAAVIGSRQFFRNAPTASRLVMDDLLHNLLVAFVKWLIFNKTTCNFRLDSV